MMPNNDANNFAADNVPPEQQPYQEDLKQQLTETNRRRDAFLALLGHELRNPLAPIQNALQVLKLESPPPGSRIPWACAVIERQLTYIARLTDNLLDVTRISRGRLELRKTHVVLTDIIQQAAANLRPLITQRDQHLDIQLPDEPLTVDADAGRLTQVVMNLLDNASRYTGEDGTLTLILRREASMAVLTVRDTGIGLLPAKLAHIFELFAAFDDDPYGSQSGLGLGLPLARQLIEMHGGRIEAASAGPDQGSEFTIRLPLAAPEHTASAPAVATQRILIVDDQEDVALALSMLLEALGYQVITANSGPEALQVVGEFQPNTAIIDIGLPHMNGFEVAKRLRQLRAADSLRLVAMTGYSQDQEQIQAAGFDQQLLKPVELPALLQAVLATH